MVGGHLLPLAVGGPSSNREHSKQFRSAEGLVQFTNGHSLAEPAVRKSYGFSSAIDLFRCKRNLYDLENVRKPARGIFEPVQGPFDILRRIEIIDRLWSPEVIPSFLGHVPVFAHPENEIPLLVDKVQLLVSWPGYRRYRAAPHVIER